MWLDNLVISNNDVIHIPHDTGIQDIPKFSCYVISFPLKNDYKHGIITKTTKYFFNSSKLLDTHNAISFSPHEKRITNFIKMHMDYNNENYNNNFRPPNTLLIYGENGIGKMDIIKSICKKMNLKCVLISPSNVYSHFYKRYDGTKNSKNFSNLRSLCNNKKYGTKIIILISNIECLFPHEDNNKDRNLISEMISIMSNNERENMIICLSNYISKLDPFIRKKFGEEIFINNLTYEEKCNLYERILTQKKFLKVFEKNVICKEGIEKIALLSHGYVYSNILLFCKTLRNRWLLKDTPKRYSLLDVLEILSKYKPRLTINSKQETFGSNEIPDVKWDDIGGLNEVKKRLEEMIIWPITHKKVFDTFGITPISGLLLYGPPGCGKTMIAKAVASAAKSNFISINIPDLIKSEIGESEKALSNVFRKAKSLQPCVIFFDEIQAIFGSRKQLGKNERKVVSQLLIELDGLTYDSNVSKRVNVIVIAATNVPHFLDRSLFTSGRFERVLYVGPPDSTARLHIFKSHFKKLSIHESVIKKVKSLVILTKGYTGADIVNLCMKAGLTCIRDERKVITIEDFESSIKEVPKSIDLIDMKRLSTWNPFEIHN